MADGKDCDVHPAFCIQDGSSLPANVVASESAKRVLESRSERATGVRQELIERPLQIGAAVGLDRVSIQALEALLADIGAEDRLTLRLSLNDTTPVWLGLTLTIGRNKEDAAERTRTFSAALDFAIGLLNARKGQ